ncbi:MAG: CHRD domain-containing protein [Longimicrobiaceae bacterium]
MKTIKICSVAALALTLAACPATDDRDAGFAAGDTLMRDTPMAGAAPGTMAGDTMGMGMSERVELGELNNSGVTGEAMINPQNGDTRVVLTVRGARPNATVQAHIHRGSCDTQGPVAAPLEAVNTDATGMGTSTSTVNVPGMTVMNGQHYVQAHTAGADPGPPTACADIPEHRM